MAWNAQLPDYFKQFDATGGSLSANVPDTMGTQSNPLASSTPGQLQDQNQNQLSQLQSQISQLMGSSVGAIAPATANATPALTSTASIPSSLSQGPSVPGAGTTTTSPANIYATSPGGNAAVIPPISNQVTVVPPPSTLSPISSIATLPLAPAPLSTTLPTTNQPISQQGAQYATTRSVAPSSGSVGDRPQEGTADWYAQQNTSRDYNATLDALQHGLVSSNLTASDITNQYRSGDTYWESILDPQRALYSSATTSQTGILTDSQGGTVDLNKLNWMNYRNYPAQVQDAWMNYNNSKTGQLTPSGGTEFPPGNTGGVDSEGHLPSWYTAGATTWQDVIDSGALLGGGKNQYGQTQTDLNRISQISEWNATGGAAAHPFGTAQGVPIKH